MKRILTLWLCQDEDGWRVVGDEAAHEKFKAGPPGSEETWRVLSIQLDGTDDDNAAIRELRGQLDAALIANVTRRINDDLEDPMLAAEQEAAICEAVEIRASTF